LYLSLSLLSSLHIRKRLSLSLTLFIYYYRKIMASPAQLAAQALSSLARVGAFVGVGATAVASAMYDGAFFLLFSPPPPERERVDEIPASSCHPREKEDQK